MIDFILEIDNAFPKELCEIIIKKFEVDTNITTKLNYTCMDTGKKMVRDYRGQIDLPISGIEGWEDINKYVENVILKYTDKYIEHYKNVLKTNVMNEDNANKVLELEPFVPAFTVVHKRTPENPYIWHQDINYYPLEHAIGTIGAVLYLNTVKPEDGGRTEFLCGRKIQPVVGKLALFPSVWTCIHRGGDSKTTKYMLNLQISTKVSY